MISLLIYLGLIYLLIGIVFAAYFVSKGCVVIDHAAENSGMVFRGLLFPASVLLWPLLLSKVRSAMRGKK